MELSRKADMALSDLATAGRLTVEQANRFIQQVIEAPTIINECRVIPMNSPSMEINKSKFGARILKAARQANPNRALTEAERSKPDTSKVTLNTSEVIAEVRLPYEVLEDNIERGNFEQTVLTMLANRVATDLEEMVIRGDVTLAGTDAYLGLQNGLLATTTANVVDVNNASVSAGMFNNMLKALPVRYRRDLNALRFYVSQDVEQDYRLNVASRSTGLGDATLTGRGALPVMGVPMKGVALMPNANAVLVDPQNLIVGFQRNVRVEIDKDIKTREIIIVVTARVATQMEEQEGAVKAINIAQV